MHAQVLDDQIGNDSALNKIFLRVAIRVLILESVGKNTGFKGILDK